MTVSEHAYAHRRAAIELIEFARGARHPLGFGKLDRFGRIDPSEPVETFITARMTYCFSVARLLGYADAELSEHGVASLRGALSDAEHGGWFVSTAADTASQRKRAYDVCFVLLAASAAVQCDVPGSRELLDSVDAAIEEHFWSPEEAALVESWDKAFTEREPYWGVNANMHGVESSLAAFAATGETRWRDRALAIAERVIRDLPRSKGWMLVEHFDEAWRPLPLYNVERPADEFRPFGVTIGHLFEWSRLLLELEAVLETPESWIRSSARELYAGASNVGWAADGAEGFVYTVDWNGAPIVRSRPHWVIAEALSAAATWYSATGEAAYGADHARWAAYAEEHFVDAVHGSWHHELDERNRPSHRMWTGKPDTYHALQAVLMPGLPLGGSFLTRLAKAAHSGPSRRGAW